MSVSVKKKHSCTKERLTEQNEDGVMEANDSFTDKLRGKRAEQMILLLDMFTVTSPRSATPQRWTHPKTTNTALWPPAFCTWTLWSTWWNVLSLKVIVLQGSTNGVSEHCMVWCWGEFTGMPTNGKTDNSLRCFPLSLCRIMDKMFANDPNLFSGQWAATL